MYNENITTRVVVSCWLLLREVYTNVHLSFFLCKNNESSYLVTSKYT